MRLLYIFEIILANKKQKRGRISTFDIFLSKKEDSFLIHVEI